MAQTRQQKANDRVVLEKKFIKANAAVVAEYRGISSEEIRSLRRKLREVNSEFKVIKNRIAIKALEQSEDGKVELLSLKTKLKGPIGVAYLNGDVAAGSKVLVGFAKDNEKFVVTGGVLEGKPLTAADVKALSDLPSREVLLARILGSLTSPHRGLMYAINGVSQNLVRVISAIKDTKSS